MVGYGGHAMQPGEVCGGGFVVVTFRGLVLGVHRVVGWVRR